MWHVIIDFIARPNLTDDELNTARDTISEFCYWHDTVSETTTTSVFYVDALTVEEATSRGRVLFDKAFEGHEVEIVAVETIRREVATARFNAEIQSWR